MPFKTAAQEYAMMINAADVWREWVRKYGHAPGWTDYKKKAAKKAAATRKRRTAKKRGKKRRG